LTTDYVLLMVMKEASDTSDSNCSDTAHSALQAIQVYINVDTGNNFQKSFDDWLYMTIHYDGYEWH